MTPEPAKFIHDTHRIVDVNCVGCELFRCHKSALVDLDMLDLIVSPDFKGLAKLRMRLMREMITIPHIKYKFVRCDGSHFWGTVDTTPLGNGLFETTVTDEG